ncbi:MAG: glycosyltransferase [Lachnospiraceae bacterium]|nr:glycosyltransferase [Lachnospiraceae bacterium]
MKYKFIFSKGPLDTLNYFSYRLIQSAISLHYEYYVIDINNPATFVNDKFLEFITTGNPIGIFFNSIGLGLTYNDKNLWCIHQIPIYNFLVDHPRYFTDIYKFDTENIHIIVLDSNHMNFIKRWFPKFKNKVYFLPDGGSPGNAIDYKSRTIDVIYTGSSHNITYENIDFFQDHGLNFYQSVISYMINNPSLTTEEAIENFIARNNNLNSDEKYALHFKFSNYVERDVRRYFKLKMMHALDRAGINVHIYGRLWEDDSEPFSSNIHIHKVVSSQECLDLIGNSKISLNCMPWFKNGCSERVFNSMLSGAVSVSDKSDYLIKNYTDGQDIILYELGNENQMAADVKWLLNHPEEAEKISLAGKRKASTNDTWYCRFNSILKLLGIDSNNS